MSFFGGLFAGSQGANFQGTAAGMAEPTTATQANASYDQTQVGLGQQMAFLKALQAQNGIANQSDVYNQLSNVAAGQGPNPAQAMLSQQTGANVANQAALMAGQRGAGANVGLMARQAGQQGAATQQAAVGQGATMEANQRLSALANMGNLAGQQVGQQAAAVQGYNQAAQNQQANILSAIQGQNQAAVSNQSNVNNVNAQIAQGNQKYQSNLAAGALLGLGSSMGMAKGGKVEKPQKMADGGAPGALPAPQIQITTGPQSGAGQYLKGINTSGGISTPGFTANAYLNDQMSDEDKKTYKQMGQKVADQFNANETPSYMGSVGSGGGITGAAPLAGAGEADAGGAAAAGSGAGAASGLGAVAEAAPEVLAASRGGRVPALVSPGEVYLNKNKAKAAKDGKISPMKAGEKIPGKPKVSGAVNSYANDTVPKKLEEGGVVIPRSITQGPNAEANAVKFVRAVLARSNLKRKAA